MMVGLLFGGGLLWWAGCLYGHRALLLAGGGSLGAASVEMLATGRVDPALVPVATYLSVLTFLIKNRFFAGGSGAAWAVYVLSVLALGFDLLLGSSFYPLNAGHSVVFFPAEKVVLMLVVPPLVLAPVTPEAATWMSCRPVWTFAALLVATLAVLVPLTLLFDQATFGWTPLLPSAVVYALAYNLVFVCVLEESFFRGILQTALMRAARRRRWPSPDSLALVGASLAFGAAHGGGGLSYALLATLAGLGYGAVYYLTGRIQWAVLLHFAVNAVHQLLMAGTPAAGPA